MRALVGLLIATALGIPASAQQIDRRDRRQPELVLDTRGRTGACDVLKFSPDGKYLLATGDDKVVRVWEVKDGALKPAERPVLRWSVWREQRGAIYAMGLDATGERVAVAGLGMRNSPLVVVLDRKTGNVLHWLPPFRDDDRFTFFEVRALAFSPGGDRIAFGSSDGRAWLWDLKGRTNREIVRLGDKDKDSANHWRLFHFESEHRLLGVAKAGGQVVRWDLSGPRPVVEKPWAFGFDVYFAEFNPRSKKLAAAAQSTRKIQVRSLDGSTVQEVPGLQPGENRCCLALSPDGNELVVGAGMVPHDGKLEGDDRILFYDVSGTEIRAKKETLRHGYHADTLTFDPTGKYLALAGGENHEVKLHPRDNLRATPSLAVGEGSGIWDLALSKDRRYLGFRNQRLPGMRPPNQRGDGPWRVFDLQERTFVEDPSRFVPHRSDQVNAWQVEVKPDARKVNVWSVTNRTQGIEHRLVYDPQREGEPRCFAFLPANSTQPTRLILGHQQGAISVYELREKMARRVRVFAGSQGEVTAVAVASDGQWLVSASSDQTITAWSLATFPRHRELGARFTTEGGKVVVARDGVDAFSPAWEAGLLPGDEIVFLAVGGVERVYDTRGRRKPLLTNPARCLAELRDPTPARELRIDVMRKGELIETLTTVRQRPLWKFFAARDGEWVLWAWQAPYYQCSDKGDRFLGPLMNARNPLATAPTLYPLEQFRGIFDNFDVIGKLLKTRDVAQSLPPAQSLKQLEFERIEPPSLRFEKVALVGSRGTKTDVVAPRGVKQSRGVAEEDIEFTVIADPRSDNPDHLPQRAELWLNDHRFAEWDHGGKATRFERTVKVPNRLLRTGKNHLTFQCYNHVAGRGEARAEAEFDIVFERRDQRATRPALHALIVGIEDYSASPHYIAKPLRGAHNDAKALGELLKRTTDTHYGAIEPRVMLNDEATSKNVLAYLEKLKPVARPDDLLLVFLAGHGEALPTKVNGQSMFVFCCPDYDRANARKTSIAAVELYEALVRVPCRKCILLDACRSGSLSSGPIRGLTPGGKGPTILAACDHKQASLEHPSLGNDGGHGLFTYAILEALGGEFGRADLAPRDGRLDDRELFRYVRSRLPALLKKFDRRETAQLPQLSPGDTEPQVLLAPGKGKTP